MLRSVDIPIDLLPAEVVLLEPTECCLLIGQEGWLLNRLSDLGKVVVIVLYAPSHEPINCTHDEFT